MADPASAASAAVDRLLHAIESGDVDGARAAYAPDATIWHNHDQVDQDVDANLRVLAWLVSNTAARSYAEVRRHVLDDGRVVQQHVLQVTFADGRTAALPACLFVTVDGDRVARIEEYLDEGVARRAFAGG
jgi:ketosteroid isomerase-like protein